MTIEPAHIFLSDKYSKKQLNQQEFVRNMFALANFDDVEPQIIYGAMRTLSPNELDGLWPVLSSHQAYGMIPMVLLLSLGSMPRTNAMISRALWCVKTINAERVSKLENVCGPLNKSELLDKVSKLKPSEHHTPGDEHYFLPLASEGQMNGITFRNTLLPTFINLKETSLKLSSRPAKTPRCESADFNRLLYGSTIIYRMLHPELTQSNSAVFSLIDVNGPISGQAAYLSNSHNVSGFDRLLTLFLEELSKMGCGPKQPLGTERYVGFYALDCSNSVLSPLLTNSDWRWLKSLFHNALSAYDPYGLFELISEAIFAAQNGGTVGLKTLNDAKQTFAQ